MPDSVELCVSQVLSGEPLQTEEAELCDFTLADQNEAMEAQGVAPSARSDHVPILGETVTYIVACVLLNEQDEVLMIQEAKQSCAGKWYLPAGRMEKNENIHEACAREVLEETGLTVDITTLLLVESAGGSWIRFVLTGKITGGNLKTPANADQESLQAKWIGNLEEVSLRAKDIYQLVERARMFYMARKSHDKNWHQDIMPGIRSHSCLMLRLVVVIKKKATNRVHILLSERTAWHLPACELHPAKSVHSSLRKFMVELFGAEVAQHKPHGLLSVEHDAYSGKDGACLTMLVSFRSPLEEVPILAKCVWHEVSKELGDKLLMRVISSKVSTIPLNVIR